MLGTAKTLYSAIALFAGILFSGTAVAQTSDPEVIQHMNWCAGDWGHNIGAQEAINIVNELVVKGYPNPVSGYVGVINAVSPQIAANTIKRPTFIQAAKALVGNVPDIAADLALTCQSHNPPVKNLLMTKRQAVIDWLRGGAASPSSQDNNCGPPGPVPCVR